MSVRRPSDETPLLAPVGQPQYDTALEGHESWRHERGASEESRFGEQDEPKESFGRQATVIATLMIGVFVANADSTLVISQTGSISSEFDSLGSSQWLFSTYALAACAAQPVVGKLSDIYGRKEMLLLSYAFFIIGNLVTGVGAQMWQVLVGRSIAGLGSAGMLSLVSLLIADLVSIRKVATWRSYVNLAATLGRSVGGPIGGALSQTIGWRWSFYGQCPLTLIAFLLVLWRLRSPQPNPELEQNSDGSTRKGQFERLRRIDFSGAVLVVLTTLCFMLAIELGSRNSMWASPVTIALFVGFLASAGAFVLVEKYWAQEPIFPVRLMVNFDILTTYSVGGLQALAQIALMYAIPLYFQVASGASELGAGSRLVPAVVGNAVGGLLCGFAINKTGKYKVLTSSGLAFACLGYALIAWRWRGDTTWAESLYIFPGGFGMGVAGSTTFIALTAGVPSADLAVAGAGIYQAMGIGAALGSCVTMSILQTALRPMLSEALRKINASKEVLDRSLEDVAYIRSLKGEVRDAVIESYVTSLMYTHVASFGFDFVAFVISLFWREYKL